MSNEVKCPSVKWLREREIDCRSLDLVAADMEPTQKGGDIIFYGELVINQVDDLLVEP